MTRLYWQYLGWFWIALIAALGLVAFSTRDDAPTAVVVMSVGAAAVVAFVAVVYLLVRFIKWAVRG
jgi:hypothetical protein